MAFHKTYRRFLILRSNFRIVVQDDLRQLKNIQNVRLNETYVSLPVLLQIGGIIFPTSCEYYFQMIMSYDYII